MHTSTHAHAQGVGVVYSMLTMCYKNFASKVRSATAEIKDRVREWEGNDKRERMKEATHHLSQGFATIWDAVF